MRPRQHWIFDNRAYSCSKEGKTWKKQKKKKRGHEYVACRGDVKDLRGITYSKCRYGPIFDRAPIEEWFSSRVRGMQIEGSARLYLHTLKGMTRAQPSRGHTAFQESIYVFPHQISRSKMRIAKSHNISKYVDRRIDFYHTGSIHLKTEFVRNIYISFVRCFLRIGLRCSSRTTFFYVKKCIQYRNW